MLELLKETGVLGCEHVTLIELDLDVWSERSALYKDVKQFKRMISKFIYIIVTKPEISLTIELIRA